MAGSLAGGELLLMGKWLRDGGGEAHSYEDILRNTVFLMTFAP